MTDEERIALLYDNGYVKNLYEKMDRFRKLRKMMNSFNQLQVLICNGRGDWRGYDVSKYDCDDPKNTLIIEEKRYFKEMEKVARSINRRWKLKMNDIYVCVYVWAKIPYRPGTKFQQEIHSLIYKD